MMTVRRVLILMVHMLAFFPGHAFGSLDVVMSQGAGDGWQFEHNGTVISGTYPVGEPSMSVQRVPVGPPRPEDNAPPWVRYCDEAVGCTIMGQDGIALYKGVFDNKMKAKAESVRKRYSDHLQVFDNFDENNPVFKPIFEMEHSERVARDRLLQDISNDKSILEVETPSEVKGVFVASTFPEVIVLESIVGFGSQTPGLFDFGKFAGFGMQNLSLGVDGLPQITVESIYSGNINKYAPGFIPLYGDAIDFYEVSTGVSYYPPYSTLSTSDRVLSGVGLIVGNGVFLRTVNNLGAAEAMRFLAETLDHVPDAIIRPISGVFDAVKKIGIDNPAHIREYADEVPRIMDRIPSSRFDHFNKGHNVNELLKQWGHRSRDSFTKYLRSNTFFEKSWTSEQIRIATDIAHNRAIRSGRNLPGSRFTTSIFGREVTIGYDEIGGIGSAWGTEQYTLIDLGLE